MPTGPANDRSRQHTFRIPLDLDSRIEAYALAQGLARNRAVIDLLTIGLDGGVHYRDTPCGSPQDAPVSPHEILKVLTRVEALEAQLEAFTAARERVQTTHQGVLNEETQHLGALCKRGHDYDGTGQSRRSNINGDCIDCKNQRTTASRAARKGK